MQTKLSIDIHKGLLEVEGDEAFVKSVYDDFRALLVSTQTGGNSAHLQAVKPVMVLEGEVQAPAKGKPRRKTTKPSGGEKAATQSGYRPEFITSLDTLGLREFLGQYAPKNQSERILIFCRFLSDVREVVPCSYNHIFTCYRAIKEKVPNAFVQAIRDTQSKHHYIEYTSPEDVTVTIAGDNHFDHDLAKAPSASAE